MSAMRDLDEEEVVAVCCSDIHFQDIPPIARSAEEDWYHYMSLYFDQVYEMCNHWEVPLIIAGDIFNKAESRPKLINFIMGMMPKIVYAVPGQHDLPNHRMDLVEKSAYWTLVKSGRIKDISQLHGRYSISNKTAFYGFGWKEEIKPPVASNVANVAVIHSYIWNDPETSYTGAPDDARTKVWRKRLAAAGYIAGIFGDNHKGFISNGKGITEPSICNCGTLMRRNIDEINYSPFVSVLKKDCKFHQVYLDTKDDKFIDIKGAIDVAEKALESAEFIRELVGIGKTLVNFRDAVLRYCEHNNVAQAITSILSESMEDK